MKKTNTRLPRALLHDMTNGLQMQIPLVLGKLVAMCPLVVKKPLTFLPYLNHCQFAREIMLSFEDYDLPGELFSAFDFIEGRNLLILDFLPVKTLTSSISELCG